MRVAKPAEPALGRPFWRATLAATAIVLLFQVAHSQAVGGFAGLIKAGEDHPARLLITREIPGVPLAQGQGHDGQLFFVIGTDLFGVEAETTLPAGDAAYRYRRIAYPLVASLGGLLGGEWLVYGLAVTTALAAGLATGAAVQIADYYGRSRWLALGVALNPGVWLSGILLTADNLALAFGLLAVLAYLRGRLAWTSVALAGAALTKEVAVCFAIGLAGHALSSGNWRRAAWMLGIAVGPLSFWMLYLSTAVGNPLSSSGQSALPLQGIFEAARLWPIQAAHEMALSILMLLFLVLGLFGLWRADVLFRWLIVPWIALGLLLSHWVWGLGSNSVRTLSPIIALVVLGLGNRASGLVGVPLPQTDPSVQRTGTSFSKDLGP